VPSVREVASLATFLLTGGMAAAVNVSARWLLNFVMPYEIAVMLAYLFGMMTAFLLMRVFVFQATGGRVKGQLVRFALVNLVAGAQVLVVSVVLSRLLLAAIGSQHQAETLAHVLAVLSPVAMSYILHKRFSFRVAVNGHSPLAARRSGLPAETAAECDFPSERDIRPAGPARHLPGQPAGGAVRPRDDMPDAALPGLGQAAANRGVWP
jgi:putative flippase GtrA